MTISTDIFIHDLILNFHEIKDEVLDEDYLGLFSQQIGCFREFTQKAIDDNNINLALKCFEFVAEYLPKVIFEVENSLVISCLGKLKIPKGSQIEGLIPKELKSIIDSLEAYYNENLNEKTQRLIKNM